MSTKARITTDFPTQGEVAARLRIPASRAAELRRQLHDLQLKNPDGSVAIFELKSSGARRSRKAAEGSRAAGRSNKKKK